MLDSFFGSLGQGGGCLQRVVSDRAFAKARDHLSHGGLQRLNTFAVNKADSLGLVRRWQGLRLVAADASDFMPAVRQSKTRDLAALPRQHLFSLYLPVSELTLFAQLHSENTCERQMLVEAASELSPDDLLILDRGYPASWLVAFLNERNIRFCMRCDKGNGFKAMRGLLASGNREALATLPQPNAQDVADFGLSGKAPEVRFVRCVTPDGKVRVLATNLPADKFACEVFGDLYHQRWRIEEAFKRLKHGYKLESVSGLTQQAVLMDVQAKVLADNLACLVCMGALEGVDEAELKSSGYRCNRTYAAQCLQRLLPRMITGLGCLVELLGNGVSALGAMVVRLRPGRTAVRPKKRVKPHPKIAYKG